VKALAIEAVSKIERRSLKVQIAIQIKYNLKTSYFSELILLASNAVPAKIIAQS
jgi:hypothetical protein